MTGAWGLHAKYLKGKGKFRSTRMQCVQRRKEGNASFKAIVPKSNWNIFTRPVNTKFLHTKQWQLCDVWKTTFKDYNNFPVKKRSCWNADHADCRLCRSPCRLCRPSVIFLLVPQFSSKIFTIVSCFLSLCALCITIICCTDVYLQGSLVGNEKIMGSCLPADVKAVSRAFSCAAFRSEHDGGR